MKFPYREIEVSPTRSSKKKRKIFRPIIPVFLLYNRKLLGYEALVDSSADYNIFDAAVAQGLGIRLTSGGKRQIAGISGNRIKGYEHTMTVKVGNRQYRTKVIFSKEIPPYSFGVLGNQGFFDQFTVKFNYRKKFIKLT